MVVHLTHAFASRKGADGARQLSTLWKTLFSDGGLQVDVFTPSPDRIVIGYVEGGASNALKELLLADPQIVDQYVT